MARKKGRLIATVSIVALGLGISGEAVAGGFALKERSARAQGLSFAGATAGSGGLSSMGFNPAAIGTVERGEIAGGLSLISTRAEGEVSFAGTPFETVDAGSMAGVGNFYAAYRISPDDLLLGLSVTSPFGLRTKYGRDFTGRFDALTSELMSLQFSPVVGLEVLPGLTLAVQGNIFYANARLTTALLGLDGDDTTASFAVGALWELGESTTIGLAYDHGYNLELTGSAQELASPVVASAQLPSTVSLGVMHELTEDIRLMGEAQWQNWSVFDRIDVTIRVPGFGPIASSDPQNYRDGFFFALGGEYDLTKQLTLRAGAAFDRTPTQDSNRATGFFSRNVRVPDEDRVWLSVGASYGLTEDITLDAGYSYLFSVEDPVVEVRTLPVSVVYDSAGAHVFSVGGSFRF